MKDECIIWQGRKGRDGRYGMVEVGYRKYMGAHRAEWIKHNGEIPLGHVVCHKCDNDLCVNINHLFLGTQKDNMRDCIKKMRFKFVNTKARIGSSNHRWENNICVHCGIKRKYGLQTKFLYIKDGKEHSINPSCLQKTHWSPRRRSPRFSAEETFVKAIESHKPIGYIDPSQLYSTMPISKSRINHYIHKYERKGELQPIKDDTKRGHPIVKIIVLGLYFMCIVMAGCKTSYGCVTEKQIIKFNNSKFRR